MNPRSRTASVYRSRTDLVRLTQADKLDLGSVVPGFACPVADLMT